MSGLSKLTPRVNSVELNRRLKASFENSDFAVMNEDIYSKFIDKLWRSVCVRLLGEMLEELKDGLDLYFGDTLLHDDGITLVKHKFLGANEGCVARGSRCRYGMLMDRSVSGPRTTKIPMSAFPTFTSQTRTSRSSSFAWLSRSQVCTD